MLTGVEKYNWWNTWGKNYLHRKDYTTPRSQISLDFDFFQDMIKNNGGTPTPEWIKQKKIYDNNGENNVDRDTDDEDEENIKEYLWFNQPEIQPHGNIDADDDAEEQHIREWHQFLYYFPQYQQQHHHHQHQHLQNYYYNHDDDNDDDDDDPIDFY